MSQDIYYQDTDEGQPAIFWGHGWGQNHASLMPLATSLKHHGLNISVDFHGFGKTPVPPKDWGTEDYADAIADFIKSKTDQKIIWMGHSFGCRVGVQLAARHPDLIAGMGLIAAAGLPRKRPFLKKLYFKARIRLYKFLKALIPFGLPEDWLRRKFGSADYLNAGPLKNIFVRVVNEDLSDIAKTITCPVLFIYGENDTETPPEIGHRYAQMIPNADIVVMDGFDHYTILSDARHRVVQKLDNFIKEVQNR